MIPQVTRKHVERALRRIDSEGVPDRRRATRYTLVHDSRSYPPKYVLSLAVGFATGHDLDPHTFSGGEETNGLLRRLGFEIRPPREGASDPRPRAPAKADPRASADEVVVVRAVLSEPTSMRPAEARRRLLSLFTRRWPEGTHAKFVVTPGGFVWTPLPTGWNGRSGWESRTGDLAPLSRTAQRAALAVLSGAVRRAAAGKANYITLGVDVNESASSKHAELVAVFDVAKGRVVAMTGKSYPTGSQEHDLVHAVDLESHFVELGGERVLVLGCHDLNMFNRRSLANQAPGGPRRVRCEEFHALATEHRPTVALQHPHSTDTDRIWCHGWAHLRAMLPTVVTGASGMNYWNGGRRRRAPLRAVLEGTRFGEVVDVVL